MRALGVTDAIFFNLGHRYITSTVLLEGPCDLPRFAAEMEAAAYEYPPLRERIVRIWPWFFAHPDSRFDIADHVCGIEAPQAKNLEDLHEIVEKARRTLPPKNRSPWRVFVVNPQPADGGETGGEPPVSAVIFHLAHGLADGIRCMQVIGGLAGRNPPVRDELKSRIPRLSLAAFNALPEHRAVGDAGLCLTRLPRRALRRDAGATDAFVEAAAQIVADDSLYAHEKPLNGCIAKTRFLRRRAGRGELGNFLQTVAESVRTGEAEARPRRSLRLPGLQKIQALPIAQYLVALAPAPLARRMMRTWYARFDAIVTVLPGPATMQMGGQDCLGVFGAPPLSGPIALAVLVISLGRFHAIVAMPGQTFRGDRACLREALIRLLSDETRAGETLSQAQKGSGAAA